MKIAKNFKKAAALTLAGAMVLSLSTGAQEIGRASCRERV